MDSEETTLELSLSLSNEQRRELHELAQHFGLMQVSRGDKYARFITLAKRASIIGKATQRRLIANKLSILFFKLMQIVQKGLAAQIIPVAVVIAASLLPKEDTYERPSRFDQVALTKSLNVSVAVIQRMPLLPWSLQCSGPATRSKK